MQAAVVNLLREIQSATGVSLLFITHDLNLLRHVADRVAVIYLGRIVEIRDAARLAEPPIWQMKGDASIRFRRDGGSVAATQDTVDGGGTSK